MKTATKMTVEELLVKLQSIQFEDAKFADAKAGAVLTLSVGLAAGAIAALNRSVLAGHYNEIAQTVALSIMFAGYLCTMLSVINAILAVMPRHGVGGYTEEEDEEKGEAADETVCRQLSDLVAWFHQKPSRENDLVIHSSRIARFRDTKGYLERLEELIQDEDLFKGQLAQEVRRLAYIVTCKYKRITWAIIFLSGQIGFYSIAIGIKVFLVR